MTAKMTKGSTVNNRLREKSGPNSDDLISFADAELQKGQASAITDMTTKNKTKTTLMTVYL